MTSLPRIVFELRPDLAAGLRHELGPEICYVPAEGLLEADWDVAILQTDRRRLHEVMQLPGCRLIVAVTDQPFDVSPVRRSDLIVVPTRTAQHSLADLVRLALRASSAERLLDETRKTLEIAERRLAAERDLLRSAMLEKGAGMLRELEERKCREVEGAQSARLDSDLGLFLHGAFRTRLAFEVDRASRTSDSIALLLVDLDAFSAFNQANGYDAGDAALRTVSRSLASLWIERPGPRPPVMGRESADCFGVLLPAANRQEAAERAEGIRNLIERLPLGPPKLTASVGGIYTHGAIADVRGLVDAARRALTQAKSSGGNGVVLLSPDDLRGAADGARG